MTHRPTPPVCDAREPTEEMTKAACERYYTVQKERGVHSPSPVSYSDMRSALYAALKISAPPPAADEARQGALVDTIVDEIRARFERNYTNMCLGAELSHIGQTQVVSDIGILLRALDAALISRIPSEEATEDEIVYLREMDAGTGNACWFVCNKIDEGTIPFAPAASPARRER